MKDFIEIQKKNTPYKVYKRRFRWSIPDVSSNARLLPYYREHIRVYEKAIELSRAIRKAKTDEAKERATTEYNTFRAMSRLRLAGLKNEHTKN